MNDISKIFPESDLPGTDTSDMNKKMMILIAEQSIPISQNELNEILKNHQDFINTNITFAGAIVNDKFDYFKIQQNHGRIWSDIIIRVSTYDQG